MVFVRQSETPKGGFSMAVLMSKSETKGDVGIEVEVEGNKFPKHSHGPHPAVDGEKIPSAWKYVKDGSLRGQDSAEYVFAKPLNFDDVPKAVKDLWKMFAEYGSKLDDSNRTSVHVHLNAQKWHMNRLTAFLAMYYCMEEVLTEWCGDHRVGNLFCLRAKDAPAIIQQVRNFIRSDGKDPPRENHHYAALNMGALKKYGSIEIRTLRGAREAEVILDWVSILERLYRLSEDYPDPRTVCDIFSGMGPLSFFETILGDKEMVVRQGIGMDNTAIADSMYEGIRLAQDLCYCRDWDLFQPLEFKPDPFGRKAAKVMNGITNSLAGGQNISSTATGYFINTYGDLEQYLEDEMPPEPEF